MAQRGGEPEPGPADLTLSPLFPQCYGVCSVGLERLPYLLVAYSLGASAASMLGLLGLWLPRQVPLVSGAGLHLLLTVSLFFWAPKPRVLQHVWILYAAAVLWGVGSALNKTGLSSEYSHGHWDGWAGDSVATSRGWEQHRHPWQARVQFARCCVGFLTLKPHNITYRWHLILQMGEVALGS